MGILIAHGHLDCANIQRVFGSSGRYLKNKGAGLSFLGGVMAGMGVSLGMLGLTLLIGVHADDAIANGD